MGCDVSVPLPAAATGMYGPGSTAQDARNPLSFRALTETIMMDGQTKVKKHQLRWWNEGGCQRIRSVVYGSPARNSDYYALLGIKHDATLEEVKQAFFSKSKKLHPDSDPANPTLHSQFVKLNEAYRVLSKESSRRHYDNLRTTERAWPTSGGHQGSPFSSADFGARSESQPNENIRYWQQFHGAPAESHSGPEVERKRRRSRRLFGYCLLIMLGSLAVHYVGFRKLEEVHNTFMDEKDRAITQIYNESKDRARSRSLEEQQELLRQKHAEFTQRYHILHKRLPEAAVAKEPSPPASAAK